MTRRYKAFISYSWADRTWGEWLHRALETYRAPKGVADGQSLHPIFKDREEEAAGGSVGAAIETALGASEFLIVICSPRSAKSTWVNREVAWFKTHKDKGRILALIVDGEPGASATPGCEDEECFPKTLTHRVGADLQPTEEWEDAPLAADARAEGDGKRGAKLKLAAALLGVGLDALVRRDERRRAVRRRFTMAALGSLAFVLGGLSLFAFTQRDAAVVARNDAVKARDDAEGLIELILTDLKSDLEGFGTLKSVTAIGNRAIGYYEGQDVKALTPDQLGRRARVLLMLGEADNKRGDLTAALARYETAAATTSEQLARDPDNAQRIFDHAQSVFWVGYIAWQRGDREKAKAQFTEYHNLAQKLVASDPANEDWQAELDYAYSNLGTLAMDDGDAASAEGWFRKSLEVALARLEKAPKNVERVLAAGQSHAWLADALFRQIKLHEAQAAREIELNLYAPFLTEEVPNSPINRANAVAEFVLAHLNIARGDLQSAVVSAERAVRAAEDLLANQPDHIENLERAALTRCVLGEARLISGELDAAKASLGLSILYATQLAEMDEDGTIWTGYFWLRPQLVMARAELVSGGQKAALDRLARLISQLDSKSWNKQNAVEKRVRIAALAVRARHAPQSNGDWRRIIDEHSDLGAAQSPDTQAILAEAYLRIGNLPAAKRVASQLFQRGYRHPDFVAAIGPIAQSLDGDSLAQVNSDIPN